MNIIRLFTVLITVVLLSSCAFWQAGTGSMGAEKTRVVVVKPDNPENKRVLIPQTDEEFAEAQNQPESVEDFASLYGPGVYAYFEDEEAATRFLATFDRGYAVRKTADGRYEIDVSTAEMNRALTKVMAENPDLAAGMVIKRGWPGVEQTQANAEIEYSKNLGNNNWLRWQNGGLYYQPYSRNGWYINRRSQFATIEGYNNLQPGSLYRDLPPNVQSQIDYNR